MNEMFDRDGSIHSISVRKRAADLIKGTNTRKTGSIYEYLLVFFSSSMCVCMCGVSVCACMMGVPGRHLPAQDKTCFYCFSSFRSLLSLVEYLRVLLNV